MARTSRKSSARQAAAAPAERVWNCAVYARLSVEDSGRRGADSIDTQIELVTSYVSECSYLSLTDTYIDNGESGKDFDRPAWNRLMDDIRSGRIDCVAVKDLSRFGRNYIETCEFLEKIFPFMGVRFVSVNDGYDSGKDSGYSEGLIIALKNLMNDRHIKDISRKISASLEARRERGEYTGSFAPFGYSKSVSEKGRLVPDEETAPIVRQIFTWRSEGIGQAAICKRLDEMGILPPAGRLREKYGIHGGDYYKAKVWQPRAIKKMLQSRIYLGHLSQGKTRQALHENKGLQFIPASGWHITEDAHEPIVRLELWEAANAVCEARRKEFFEDRIQRDLPENIFKGFLVCGSCGTKLTRHACRKTNPSGKSYEYFYYACSLKRQHPVDEQFSMTRFDIIYDVVYPLVSQELVTAANLGAVIEKRSKQKAGPRTAVDSEISRSARELETINSRLAKLYEDYVDGLLNEHEYVCVKSGYEQRAESLREQMEALSKRAALIADVSASDNRWLRAALEFKNPTELTREMLEAIVERVEVSGPQSIKVVWKFRDEFALLEACAGEDAC
jgi:DNA invertase Pin-like site-specific DNA recombinase/rubrerythrin